MKIKKILIATIFLSVLISLLYGLAGYLDKRKTEASVGSIAYSEKFTDLAGEGPYEIFIPIGYQYIARSNDFSEINQSMFSVGDNLPEPNCLVDNLPWLSYEKAYKPKTKVSTPKEYTSYIRSKSGVTLISGGTFVRKDDVFFWAGRNLPNIFLEPEATDLLLMACLKQGNKNVWQLTEEL